MNILKTLQHPKLEGVTVHLVGVESIGHFRASGVSVCRVCAINPQCSTNGRLHSEDWRDSHPYFCSKTGTRDVEGVWLTTGQIAELRITGTLTPKKDES